MPVKARPAQFKATCVSGRYTYTRIRILTKCPLRGTTPRTAGPPSLQSCVCQLQVPAYICVITQDTPSYRAIAPQSPLGNLPGSLRRCHVSAHSVREFAVPRSRVRRYVARRRAWELERRRAEVKKLAGHLRCSAMDGKRPSPERFLCIKKPALGWLGGLQGGRWAVAARAGWRVVGLSRERWPNLDQDEGRRARDRPVVTIGSRRVVSREARVYGVPHAPWWWWESGHAWSPTKSEVSGGSEMARWGRTNPPPDR